MKLFGPVHAYAKFPVPPLTETLMDPDDPPKHAAFVEFAFTLMAWGWLIIIVVFALQSLRSVTVYV